MKINLEEKSKELKGFVSQYETRIFLGEIASLMYFIRFGNPGSTLQGLTSPQRQLYYLAGLNITSTVSEGKEKKQPFSDKEFFYIKELLSEIEKGYAQLFYPDIEDKVDQDWVMKRKVAMPTFLSYFNQGQLNYEEQVIERIEEYFMPFDQAIVAHLGVGVQDFLKIYNHISATPNDFFKKNINKQENYQTWEEYSMKMIEENPDPSIWGEEDLPSHFRNFSQFIADKGQTFRFSRQQLEDQFGSEKTSAFLAALTCNRSETNFLYYTEKNVLHSKPIFSVGNSEFQTIEIKQIIHAIYSTLMDFCTKEKTLAEKFYKVRGQKLEDKTERVFKRFFRKKRTVYKGYYTLIGREQDLLILVENLALIIEAKASKRDEPRRDPDKAYPLILTNFNETIQKGYDQADRVKKQFLERKPLKLYQDKNLSNCIADINTKGYQFVFSIIVTLERFGQIQTDLSELLNIRDDDKFPWSVCIDDLEVFLLQLEKMGKRKMDLVRFLNLRQKLHEKLITDDELDVCGGFLTGEINHKKVDSTKSTLILLPNLSDIFDDTYQKKGLGFKNEKNLEDKTSGKYLPIGGF